MPTITTILFDWGGVLIDDPAPGLASIMSQHLGVSPDAFRSALHRNAEPFTKGTCPESAFWQTMCADLNVPLPTVASLWGHAFQTVYRRKEDMWTLARTLRQNHYKIGLLSNTESCAVEYYHTHEPKIFDALIFSCCESCRKPEPLIYRRALEKLNARPEQTVFIDDNEHYTQGAAAVGIHALQFKDHATLLQDLRSLGILIP
jgi:FMN phosphatase YigB (HAD superfamily)